MAIVSLKRRKRRKKRRVELKRKRVLKRRRRPAPKPKPKAKPKPVPKPAPKPAEGPAPLTSVTTPIAAARERLFLNRFGTGFTQAALTQLREAGTPEEWLEQQLDPASVAESAKVAQVDSWFSFLWGTPVEKYAADRDGSKSASTYGRDFGSWSILRRIYSQRTVLEEMTDFWSTNLHIPVTHSRAWIWRFEYDATIREHALGRFEDLLVACSLHPSMRFYLDNYKSVKGKPNENQGRELLELHTVGLEAGYTEAMVKASAVLLSGYTADWGGEFGVRYDTAKHTTGAVQVLGFSHANASADGQAATMAYLSYLAHHPATARNLARKLATWFVSDTPSEGLLDALAAAYLEHDTDISAMLRVLAAHPEFLSSAGQKVRTPIADLVATARVLGIDVKQPVQSGNWATHANYLHNSERAFTWPRPDGPPVTNRAWSSAARVFGSYKMHGAQAAGYTSGATYRPRASWLPASAVRFDAYVDHLSRTWLGRRSGDRLLKAAVEATGVPASTVITPKHAVADWKFQRLALVLLDSPDHMTT